MPETAPVILVVDDREDNRYISSQILRKAGYSVEEAASGREALASVLDDPALVILDVRLPDVIGYEVCRRIKENPRTANIPVLQVSAAFTSSESRVQALDSGADAYLTQPLEPTVLLATVRALLRLREAESLSRLSAKQWQATFDALTEGIALIDSNWCVVRCNRAMKQLLGKTYSEIERQDARDLLRRELNLDLPNSDLCSFANDTQRGRRWFSVRADSIRDGEIIRGGILIVTEITDRRLAEEALRVTERLAATGRLANSIAHEINNPLEAITNLLYLLTKSNHDAATARYLRMAGTELERVSRITRQTLVFNRDSNQPVEIELPELLDGVVTLYTPQFNERGLRVVRKYNSPSSLLGFPGELGQVFSNVLRNAMEALPAEGGTIMLYVHPSVDWKDLSRYGIRVSIIDSGTGMIPDIRRNVFEPFFTTKQLKGSGLGLWLSAGIISKHQGRIAVRSSITPGRSGTCFSIFLPTSQKGTVSRASHERNEVA